MIISELFYREIEQLFSGIDQNIAGIDDAGGRLRAFIEQASRGIVENNDFFKMYVSFLTCEAQKPGTARMLTTFFDGYVTRLAVIIRDGVGSGVFREVDAECIARAAYSLMVGSIFIKYIMKVDIDVDYQNTVQIDLLLESIKK